MFKNKYRGKETDIQKYCPDSCESLYGGKCIMRIDGKYNGGFPLLYDEVKLGRRYIRREDCLLLRCKIEEEDVLMPWSGSMERKV